MLRCMIGMSGGVDSSVAAYLLKEQGYDCIGATVKLCGDSGENAADAEGVCRQLGIPHETFDFTADFEQRVMTPFVRAYESGATPNPCIACNQSMKFGALWHQARALGCDCLATGHYARITEEEGLFRLKKASNAGKDQSYVLYFLSQEQLRHIRFPLGGLTKDQVREIARQQGFASAAKPESQDICFVPDGDYGAFLERYTGKQYAPGDFVDRDGKVLGRHRGAVRYTLGQRKGLGVPAATRLYVTGKDMERNTVTLGSNAELHHRPHSGGPAADGERSLTDGQQLWAKVRYRQKEQPCRVWRTGERCIRVVFDMPQRAVTGGQAVVLYDGDTVVGGATITG